MHVDNRRLGVFSLRANFGDHLKAVAFFQPVTYQNNGELLETAFMDSFIGVLGNLDVGKLLFSENLLEGGNGPRRALCGQYRNSGIKFITWHAVHSR